MDPEILKKQQEAVEEARKQRQKKMEEAQLAINSAGENPNVRILLRHLLVLCGVFANPLVLNEHKEITNAVNYNIGRQSVYHDLRNLMSIETRNQVERGE